MPSPETNTAFQKLFGLPSEEFLINDLTCRLKRKMLVQVQLHSDSDVIDHVLHTAFMTMICSLYLICHMFNLNRGASFCQQE